MTPLFDAETIARILTDPGKEALIPTDEQRTVIESPMNGSTLVIAGAGSGKTETIANRVVWLVANGLVAPSEVLGLTFTRKAAGELAERMRGRLMLFAERALLAELTEPQRQRAVELSETLTTTLDLPEVSTYNAFASALVQEFGSAQGIGGQLIDESVAWGIAREVVTSSRHAGISALGMSVNRLTELTLSLAHEVSDHLSTYAAAREALMSFADVPRLPYDEKALARGERGEKVYAAIASQAEVFEHTSIIVDLAEAYSLEKRERGVLEFSDQVALALEALSKTPQAVTVLRHRHRVVLLDEVQDTSVGQTRLLTHIFAGQHVMAVGDPHQSIYGWRGASTESLSKFHDAFSPSATAAQRTLTLSTSWRNSLAVLEAANRAALPLRMSAQVPVPVLQARPGATQGELEVAYEETLDEEASRVAQWLLDERVKHSREHAAEPPTAAVIFRKRKDMPLFAEALRERGIPSRIVGIGGLLETPEVSDLVATLRCVWYADASSELVRLLCGPRFAIGPADIAGLRDAARWFARRDFAQQRIVDTDYARSALESLDREVSLVDALDMLRRLPYTHASVRTMSETGFERMREAAEMLRGLRSLIAGDVIDLIRAAIEALRLDIELEANERFSAATSATARENLHSLTEAVRGFLQVSPDRSLQAVLEWLEFSEREDALPAFIPAPEPGTVQLITVHSSKGLEWDLVAVPRQSATEFPSKPRSSKGELAVGVIPDRCRGDARSRPVGLWAEAETQKEAREAMAQYQREQAAAFAEEELRLIYVAYTRAKKALLLSGCFWSGRKTSLEPSEPLKALRAQYEGMYVDAPSSTEEGLGTAIIDELPDESKHEEAPEHRAPRTLTWPLDALGTRHDRVHRAAAMVRDAEAVAQPDAQTELLLAEAAEGAAAASTNSMFARINASGFHDFIHDPEAAEARALRPVPQRPYRRTRIGNLFHDWVERRTTTPLGTSLELALEENDETVSDTERQELEQLIATFEASRWATRQPIAVEQQITFPFAGRRAVCKLDAVYANEGRIEIVDWKTGRTPGNDEETAQRLLQLDLYRVAYALHTETPLEDIDVSLFYVDANVEIRSETPREKEELEALWLNAYATITG
ncbi:ATP-dependent helicase [Leucobacter sp. UCMA 4100]|uniref:ATP-dependent DNA helicase n=1 Tax=Leucobacter sp. UCMA 4100 TaxID=2810534 RepID=UPI0022EAB50A|nr:ATP-dependent DNA helicase [Leucobacter sp. UCMA 4100]MDA3146057.1 ATP-dependent helicase [Leucobacter sp. UCMA 4100]